VKNMSDFAIFKTSVHRLLFLLSGLRSSGQMDLFDALNPMAMSVWTYGPCLGRYSEKRDYGRAKKAEIQGKPE